MEISLPSSSMRAHLLGYPQKLKEQVSSTRVIYLHMFQLPQNWIALQYMHNHSRIPIKCGGGVGLTRVVCHHHLQHHGVLFCWGLTHSFLNIYKCIRAAPARKIMGPHPMMCTPLGHLGNTFLLNLRAYRDPSQAHNSYQ